MLIIAREIQFRGYPDARAVPLIPVRGHGHALPAGPSGRGAQPLAAATGLQRTNLSAVLRGLERKGLIERHASPDDRRGATVHPTERGKTQLRPRPAGMGRRVPPPPAMTAPDLDEALALLRKISTSLTTSRPAEPGRPAALM